MIERAKGLGRKKESQSRLARYANEGRESAGRLPLSGGRESLFGSSPSARKALLSSVLCWLRGAAV